MSAAVRRLLADAANTVEGVAVTPYYEQLVKPGHGAVFKAGVDYPNFSGGVVRWAVAVLLPDDLGASERFLDDSVPALVAALQEHLYVDEVAPQSRSVNGKPIPMVYINGHLSEGE